MPDLYYAQGLQVRKRPVETKHANGTSSSTMGFVVCTCDPDVSHAAIEVAKALNRADGPQLGNADLLLAMEWGLRAHEKGLNLEAARADFYKLLTSNG